MRLEEYWGIGPKTKDRLVDSLGTEAAIEAIESADVRTLTRAGLSRGRATQILRHAHGGAAMDVLATPDGRTVYKQLLEIIGNFAVTEDTADRIRILTPLSTREAMERRQQEVARARESWENLDDAQRKAVTDAFETDEVASDGRQPAVRTALELKAKGLESGVFEGLEHLDETTLENALAALTGLAGKGDRVEPGADDELDSLREQLAALEDLRATPASVLESIQSDARGPEHLRDTFANEIASQTGVAESNVRETMVEEAADAHGFVTETLRGLVDEKRSAVEKQERQVASAFETTLEETSEDVDRTVETIENIALSISLARFAESYDLTEPRFRDEQVTGVVDARNLFLEAGGESVQPITYAVGDHALSVPGATVPPEGDRVTVLTGANSGGKTTLLETLCQVQLLAQMGLPVPAVRAEVSVVDSIVFHRRHASFNAGVLESTLRSVVPPLTDSGKTLMLVDEFEAITEPGSAAELLHGLVTLTVDRGALGVFVTHLAEDLEPLPERARVDGIFAEGLTSELELEVDYQPRFETVGRSTPEFIVSRLVAGANDRGERAGYETLAKAVGEQAVQRTLLDAEWST